MIPSSPSLRRCIYCAFQARKDALRSLRFRSNASTSKSSVTPRYRRGLDIERPTGAPSSTRDRLNTSRRSNDVVFKDGRMQRNSGRRSDFFPRILDERLAAMKEELKKTPLVKEMGGESEDWFERLWKRFAARLVHGVQEESMPFRAPRAKGTEDSKNSLKDAFERGGLAALEQKIKHLFYDQVTGSRFSESDIKNQKMLADLRYPSEWYPATRTMHRTIHMHVGPTNSGKTYHALKRMETAAAGIYAGPLRLLAHEVYTRMNAAGKHCALITGEERRRALEDNSEGQGLLSACTVEMVPLNATVEVAVLDEIQMIGSQDRGWAWTQALLGVKAEEVHLCGEERSVPIVQEICASIGDKLEVHRYERLSPLKIADESLNGDLGALRKGDCIVSFSVMGIHALRKQIEAKTGKKVATVYGGLPPETRAAQARLFNDPDNDYDYIVASDAVGMGLNLAIRRIIFEAASKFDGYQQRTLSVADIKQIGGRAGRYRTAHQATEKSASDQKSTAMEEELSRPALPVQTEENVGIVTTLEKHDFPIVAAAMRSEPEPIRSAGIFPPAPVLERFASYFPPATPFSYILTRLHELSQMHSRFHLCGLKDQVWVADLIEPVKGLSIMDRNTFCATPASRSDKNMFSKLLPAYARCIVEQTGGNLANIPELPLETLEMEVSASREYLRALESLHKGIVAYLWLSYRFAGVFSTRALAFHVKQMVEEKIEHVLEQFSYSEGKRKKIASKRAEIIARLDNKENVEMEEQTIEDADEDAERNQTGSPADLGRYLSPEHTGAEENGVPELQPDSNRETFATKGGDRFSGEQDMNIGLDDPLESDLVDSESEDLKPRLTRFSEWRSQQTRGESQDSYEPHDAEMSFSAAKEKAVNTAAEAVVSGELEVPSAERPSVADVAPQDALAAKSAATGEAVPLEQNVEYVKLDAQGQRPVETQGAAPKPAEARVPEEKKAGLTEGQERFGSGVPPKHLAHLDAQTEALGEGRKGVERP